MLLPRAVAGAIPTQWDGVNLTDGAYAHLNLMNYRTEIVRVPFVYELNKPISVEQSVLSVKVSDTRALGRALAEEHGWSGKEWTCLELLWTKESNWRPEAQNRYSSAYGIPQAMISLHDVGEAYLAGDPTAQIEWGLDYIKRRYLSPCNALAHSTAKNYY